MTQLLRALASGVALTLAASACCTAPVRASTLPSGAAGVAAWRGVRGELKQLRDRYTAREPYSMNVALELTQLALPLAAMALALLATALLAWDRDAGAVGALRRHRHAGQAPAPTAGASARGEVHKT